MSAPIQITNPENMLPVGDTVPNDLNTIATGIPSDLIMHNIAMYMSIIIAVLVISLILKGFSLWYSARNNQKNWFIALLLINTFGILEAIYLLFFRKEKAVVAPIATNKNNDGNS
jgi:hypothetical protein